MVRAERGSDGQGMGSMQHGGGDVLVALYIDVEADILLSLMHLPIAEVCTNETEAFEFLWRDEAFMAMRHAAGIGGRDLLLHGIVHTCSPAAGWRWPSCPPTFDWHAGR